MNRIALSAGLCAALLTTAGLAHADNRMEVGGFAGIHVFSHNNELGTFDADNAPSLENAIAFGIRVAARLCGRYSAEGELAVVPTNVRIADVDVVAYGWRLSAVAHLMTGDFKPFVLLGVGGSTASSVDRSVLDNDTDLVPHLGLGAKYTMGTDWGLRADARMFLPPSSASEGPTTDWELTIGLTKTFSAVAAPAPVAARDDDGDGVVGDADKCPAEAEDVDGFEDADGCPDPDNDGDGVADASDACRDQAETQNGFQDADGCPDELPDDDGDGIVGSADRCPDQAEDIDGFQDSDGCPDPDNDGDGVADTVDKCPAELETVNGYLDQDGCPDAVPAEVAAFTGIIKGVSFVGNTTKLAPSSRTTLDAAAALMAQHGDLHIEISVHTDARGDHDKNVALSQQRADTIKAYLVGKGIAADRLTAVGHGPDQPAFDNATPAGRQNRRVEFRLLPGAAATPGDGQAPATQPSP